MSDPIAYIYRRGTPEEKVFMPEDITVIRPVCPRCKGSALDPEDSHPAEGPTYSSMGEPPVIEPCRACQYPPCPGCGHVVHAGECRQLCMDGPPGEVGECGCLGYREEPPVYDRSADPFADDDCGEWVAYDPADDEAAGTARRRRSAPCPDCGFAGYTGRCTCSGDRVTSLPPLAHDWENEAAGTPVIEGPFGPLKSLHHRYNGEGRLHGVCRCGEGRDAEIHRVEE